jgi:hypothetical protein
MCTTMSRPRLRSGEGVKLPPTEMGETISLFGTAVQIPSRCTRTTRQHALTAYASSELMQNGCSALFFATSNTTWLGRMQGYEQLPILHYGSFFATRLANGGQHERRLWHDVLHNRPAAYGVAIGSPSFAHCGIGRRVFTTFSFRHSWMQHIGGDGNAVYLAREITALMYQISLDLSHSR